MTAGLDSRLVLALLRAAGVDMASFTMDVDDLDVEVGRAIAATVGVPHEVVSVDRREVVENWEALARRAVF